MFLFFLITYIQILKAFNINKYSVLRILVSWMALKESEVHVQFHKELFPIEKCDFVKSSNHPPCTHHNTTVELLNIKQSVHS